MAGSSLGGNITQFIGLEYQDQIGCLGVFSSANWLHQEAFDAGSVKNYYLINESLSVVSKKQMTWTDPLCQRYYYGSILTLLLMPPGQQEDGVGGVWIPGIVLLQPSNT